MAEGDERTCSSANTVRSIWAALSIARTVITARSTAGGSLHGAHRRIVTTCNHTAAIEGRHSSLGEPMRLRAAVRLEIVQSGAECRLTALLTGYAVRCVPRLILADNVRLVHDLDREHFASLPIARCDYLNAWARTMVRQCRGRNAAAEYVTEHGTGVTPLLTE